MDTGKIVARLILLSSIAAGSSAQAKTIAWYRFEEATSGVTTQSTVFTNAIDATKLPAYPAVCPFNGNGKYSKSGLAYTAANMPMYTNAFPSTIALTAPGDSNVLLENRGAAAINTSNVNLKNNPVGAILIDDDESLRLQTFTIEFFARIPKTTEGWRCLFCRTADTYGKESFLLHGQIGGSGMYMQFIAHTVENPLRDEKGSVTNRVKHTVTLYDQMDKNLWQHFAVTCDGTAKKVTIYRNHSKVSSFDYEGEIWYDPGWPMAFGANPQCSYYGCTESIDEIRISDTVLTTDEMLGYRHNTRNDVVDENTLFYFPFEGSTVPVTVGEGDMFAPITYTPFYENRAVNIAWSGVSATPRAVGSVPQSAPSPASDLPTDGVRFGLRGQAFQENNTSVHIMTNAPGSFAQPVVIPETFNQLELGYESFTAEMYFKAVRPGYMGSTDLTHFFAMYGLFEVSVTEKAGLWSSGWISAKVGDIALRRPHSIASQQTLLPDYCTNKWHHLALVYDKENGRGELWLNGQLKLWLEGLSITPSKHKSYYNSVLIGGCYWGRSLGNMYFDDVRISRGALRPYQFLTTKAVESGGDLLARATFESGLAMSPYSDFFTAPSAGAFVPGGATPVTDAKRPARVLTDGEEGALVTDSNRRSLRFSGGKVVYPGAALLSDTDEFTVEFFLNAPSATAGAGIARVNRGTTTDVTNAVTWALSFANADGELSLKVDTADVEGQTHVFSGASFADGRWHHVGLQFEADGEDTVARLYRDAALVGTWNVTGRLPTRLRESNFMLGAGETPGAGFTGWIDEIRVTPGVLAPSKFMTPLRRGTILVVR